MVFFSFTVQTDVSLFRIIIMPNGIYAKADFSSNGVVGLFAFRGRRGGYGETLLKRNKNAWGASLRLDP